MKIENVEIISIKLPRKQGLFNYFKKKNAILFEKRKNA